MPALGRLHSGPAADIPSRSRRRFFSSPWNKRPPTGVVPRVDSPVPDGQSTFETVIQPHLDAAYNLARWLLRHQQDAEDAVQEACLRAHRSLDRFRPGDGRPWLLTIVRNVCYSHLRASRRAGDVQPFDDELHGTTNERAQVDALAFRQADQALLERAMDRLTPEYREVIVLYELENLAYRDIAAVVAIPIGTVMSRLSRARNRLQAEVIALGREESAHGL
ncbi:MAG TPA: sigma-70 family RNA polymerase sigma factor [Planctomycetota bacterium]|nr:sigma-70 family RNA polymerase sigma factor [Planctomycetota bacterium]